MNQDMCCIYIFCQRKRNAFFENIFYVGSTKHIHQRVVEHINAIYDSSEKNNLYSFINSNLGTNNFHIHIVDHVPITAQKAYERIYFDLLLHQQCDLKNSYKPIPETNNVNMITDLTLITRCAQNLIKLQQKEYKSSEDLLINELKKQTCNYKNIIFKDHLNEENRRLRSMNKELRKELIIKNEEIGNFEETYVKISQLEQMLKIKEDNIMLLLQSKQLLNESNNNKIVKTSLVDSKVSDSEGKRPPKKCVGCNKYISYKGFATHLKTCKKYQNLPTYEELLNIVNTKYPGQILMG